MIRPSSNLSLKDVLNKHKSEIMLEMNCHAIGIIESFDSTNQTCTVKINYLKTRLVKDSQDEYVEENYKYPLLLDCPTMIYHGGDSGLTMPIKSGDNCLVLFNDRDIDNWFSGANEAPVATTRKHSLSDGIVFVGLNNAGNEITNYDSDNPVLYNQETKITVKSDKVLIENSTDQLGVLLRELIDEIKAIQTTPAVVGNPSAISPASQTLIEAVALKIEGLLE